MLELKKSFWANQCWAFEWQKSHENMIQTNSVETKTKHFSSSPDNNYTRADRLSHFSQCDQAVFFMFLQFSRCLFLRDSIYNQNRSTFSVNRRDSSDREFTRKPERKVSSWLAVLCTGNWTAALLWLLWKRNWARKKKKRSKTPTSLK